MVPGRGRVGFFAQSGALGVALLERARSRGIGLSTFVSAGNRADVSGNDLLQYWATDPGTEVVLLHLESFGNPRKFARLARTVGRTKPVVAVKSGRHVGVTPGLAGTSVAVPEQSVAALFASAGVIRVETVAQMFDVGTLLAHQPLPAGDAGRHRRQLHRHRRAGRRRGARGGPAARPRGAGRHRRRRHAGAVPRRAPGARWTTTASTRSSRCSCRRSCPGSHEFGPALRDVAAGSAKPVLASFLSTEGVPPELAVLDENGMPARGLGALVLHARAGGHRAGEGRGVRPLAAPAGRGGARAARRRRGRRTGGGPRGPGRGTGGPRAAPTTS